MQSLANGCQKLLTQLSIVTPATSTINIGYELDAYPCDQDSNRLDAHPVVNQGNPVRFCVSLLDPSSSLPAYVAGINSMSYRSDNANLGTVAVVTDGGVANSLSHLDCSQLQGGKFGIDSFAWGQRRMSKE